MNKPDICTSLNCTSFPCGYCSKCSHSIFLGEGTDINGKKWKWEFNRMFGPIFLRKDDEPLKNQPISENHPVWEVFEKWIRTFSTS